MVNVALPLVANGWMGHTRLVLLSQERLNDIHDHLQALSDLSVFCLDNLILLQCRLKVQEWFLR